MIRLLAALLMLLPLLANSQGKLSQEELERTAREMARLEGEIARNLEEYTKRPRRLVVGNRGPDDATENYVKSISQKIENVGTLNYPWEARGKISGAVTVQFDIYADGTLRNAVVVKSSGHEVLDNAAKRAVSLASPGYPFPQALKERAEILVVIRTFHFIKSEVPQ